MLRGVTLALATGLLVLAAAPAADKTAAKPAAKHIGTWSKSVDDTTITFAVKPEVLLITLKRGEQKLEAEADYAVTKDGVLFGRIRKVTKDIDGGPAEGDLFSFRVKHDKDKVVLSDLKGTHGGGDEARNLVEGEYSTKGK